MAYGQPPPYSQHPTPPGGPRVRPGTVTAAVWTQFLTALVLVLTAVSLFTVQGTVQDAVEDELTSDPSFQNSGLSIDDVSTLVTVMFAFVAGVYILFAVFYVVLGLLNNRGARPARILSWVLSGIGLACCGLGGLVNAVGSTTMTWGDTEYEDETTRAIEEATPGWVSALEWITLIVLIFGSLLIIILLALPASNEFFRKEQPQQYPTQYPGQQPPYGQQPPGNQPPYGQQPPEGQQPPYGQQPPGNQPPYGQQPPEGHQPPGDQPPGDQPHPPRD